MKRITLQSSAHLPREFNAAVDCMHVLCMQRYMLNMPGSPALALGPVVPLEDPDVLVDRVGRRGYHLG